MSEASQVKEGRERRAAPATVGMESRKEKVKALEGEIPSRSEVVIVVPDLERPGRMAAA